MCIAVAAPGKVNDLRAFNCCMDLLTWLDALPGDFYIFTNNTYTLLRLVLIPFTKPDMMAAGLDYDIGFLQTCNVYLYQLQMRIKMAFGCLTTKCTTTM